MVPGWNYVRAIHTVGGTDYATNYIEWINDPSGAVNDLSATNARIENIALVGSKDQASLQRKTVIELIKAFDDNDDYSNKLEINRVARLSILFFQRQTVLKLLLQVQND